MAARWVRLEEIRTHPDFSVFPVGGKVADIAANMRQEGFDRSEPLVIWLEEDYLVDGHQRLEAARRVQLSEVYVEERSFVDFEAALDYAIKRQRDRRNLTTRELRAGTAKAVQIKDRRKPPGERTDLASVDARSGKSAAETAEVVGTSQATVERIRHVLEHGDEETKQEMLAGDISPTAAVQEVKRKRKAREPKPRDNGLRPETALPGQWLEVKPRKPDPTLGSRLLEGIRKGRGLAQFGKERPVKGKLTGGLALEVQEKDLDLDDVTIGALIDQLTEEIKARQAMLAALKAVRNRRKGTA